MFIYAGQLMNEEEPGVGAAFSVNTEGERDGGVGGNAILV